MFYSFSCCCAGILSPLTKLHTWHLEKEPAIERYTRACRHRCASTLYLSHHTWDNITPDWTKFSGNFAAIWPALEISSFTWHSRRFYNTLRPYFEEFVENCDGGIFGILCFCLLCVSQTSSACNARNRPNMADHFLVPIRLWAAEDSYHNAEGFDNFPKVIWQNIRGKTSLYNSEHKTSFCHTAGLRSRKVWNFFH